MISKRDVFLVFVFAIAILVLLETLMLGVPKTSLVTMENHAAGTWLGMVKLLTKDGKVVDYNDMPNMEIKHMGSVSSDLMPGLYGVTHFRPAQFITVDNVKTRVPAKILNFVTVRVTKNKPVTLIFDCVRQDDEDKYDCTFTIKKG
jgi:hypothetical protein